MNENGKGNGVTALVVVLVALLAGLALWAGYQSMNDTSGIEIEAGLSTEG